MNQIITFGQYKGKTFEYVMNHDLNYCGWILDKCIYKHALSFKTYLTENLDLTKKYNLDNIQNKSITCLELSKYYEFNDQILNKIKLNKLHISSNSLNFTIKLNKSVPPNIFGTFMDYYIRYMICKLQNKTFIDMRAKNIIDAINYGGIGEAQYEDYKYEYDLLHDSYKNCMELNATILDIYNTSICSGFWFGEVKYLQYSNKISGIDTAELDKYLLNKINNKKNILCNPDLTNKELQIKGDADLIIDDELIDFKTSENNMGEYNKNYVQLLIYCCLYYQQSNIKCNTITILNVISGYEYSIDISNWDYNLLLDLLKDRCKIYKYKFINN